MSSNMPALSPEALRSSVQSLAQRAMQTLCVRHPAYGRAMSALRRPMNYMRYAELPAALTLIELTPGMKVLDVSSPQWLSLWLAAANPAVDFTYINIIESELAGFGDIAQACGLVNLHFLMADVRALEMPDASFDRVLSISVIEHVYPEQGGDLQALAEIKRVLKPDGRIVVTVPFKHQASTVYSDGAVYERAATTRSFYAREYDAPSFAALVRAAELKAEQTLYVCERPGLGALDHWEWGPGKGTASARVLLLAKKLVERSSRRSLDPLLARRHLVVAQQVQYRPVNVVCRLAMA